MFNVSVLNDRGEKLLERRVKDYDRPSFIEGDNKNVLMLVLPDDRQEVLFFGNNLLIVVEELPEGDK